MVIWVMAIAAFATMHAAFQYIRNRQLSSRIENLRDSLAKQTRKLEFVEEKFHQDLARLNYELRKETGSLRFTENMTFKEALALNPKVEEIMGAMHVGGCPDCAVELNETLAYGATKNSVDVEEFLIALNHLPGYSDPNKEWKGNKGTIKGQTRLNVI